MEIVKDLAYNNWWKLVIIILIYLLFKSCQTNNKVQLANVDLKKEVNDLIDTADLIASKNRALRDTIAILEIKSQNVKTKIVYTQNKTKSDVKKVATLNTKHIANYYQERYKLPIIITKYGVSLSDTIAKKNIIELIQKDGCFAEVKLFQTQLQIEEQKGIFKDTIIGNITKANVDLNQAIFTQRKIINNAENSLQKEKNKKTFWQVTSGILAAGAGYLLITK